MSIDVDFDVDAEFYTETMVEGFNSAEVKGRGLQPGKYQVEILSAEKGMRKNEQKGTTHRFFEIKFEIVGGPEGAIGKVGDDHQGLNLESQLGIHKSTAARLGFTEYESLQDLHAKMSEQLPGTQWNITVKPGKNGYTNLYWDGQLN